MAVDDDALRSAIRGRSPLIVRGGCARWRAARLWTSAHLRAAEPDALVDVQLLADGELSGAAGAQAVARMRFAAQFLGDAATRAATLYLAQCDLDDELPALAREAPALPPFGARALRGVRARRLLWLNRAARVRSALHYDGYDSVLCCLRGRKALALLPPRAAAGARVRARAPHGLSPNHAEPHAFDANCALEAGDCVFIPQGWWHQVESEMNTLAISYWFAAPGTRALHAALGRNASCSAAPFVLREAARAVVQDEQRRRLDALARRALPGGSAPPSPAALAHALSRAPPATRTALLWAACPRALAAALLQLARQRARNWVARWVARGGARAAYALTVKLDEAGRGACAHGAAPALSDVLFAGARGHAVRALIVARADAYCERVGRTVLLRTLGIPEKKKGRGM
ncbi:hypothetical protein KFE25_007623 [Diacronema lutheri]|uniref:JmjC domain-containing protein n=1 Tax=Diacronema lutheri TaxID=2081491 RepID=A0A8J5Y0N0_DIALT|nr:hypothetical protein KFE25_007623 [Diacronema lutheri]